MSLPDAVKMISDLPGALCVSVLDASGVAHRAAITQTELAPQASDMGVAFAGNGDTLYVAKPFLVPPSEKIAYTDAAGGRHVRRAESVQDNVVFLAIVLGEETA